MKYFYFALSLIFLFSCQNGKKEETEITIQGINEIVLSAEKIKLAGIESGTIQSRQISEKIYCKGKLMAKPQNRVKYSAPTEGYVKRIFIQNGKYVKKGALLISLEHPKYISLQKEFLKVSSNLDYLQKEYERQKELFDNNAGKGKVYEKTQSEYEQAKAEYSALKLELRMININSDNLTTENIRSTINFYAPISGNINEVNISIGQYVSFENVLFEIINNTDFVIELDVFERDIHKILIGQKLKYDCSIPESRDSVHIAEILSVGNYIDPITKTFKVQAKPMKFEEGMRHGIFLNAQINLSESYINVVPDEAIIFQDDETFLFTINNDTVFIKKPVETGIQVDGFTEVINKDLDKKIIVLKGANYVIAEMDSE